MCFSFFTCLSVSLSFHLALSSHVSLFCFISLLPLLNALCVVCCCVCCVLWLGSACCCGCSWCGCGCVVVSAFLLVLHFKTLPCVRSKRSRVYFQNASVTQDTGVLMAHTGAFWTYTRKRFEGSRSLPSLSLSASLLVSLSPLSCVSFLSLSLFISPSFSSLSLPDLINNDNDRSSRWLLVRWPVRIMQETIVEGFLCKPRTPWNEVGLYLCWKEKRCAWCGVYVLYVFVRVAIWCCVLSWLSSLCCWLRQRWRRCVGCCVVRKWRFLKKKVIAHKLHPQGIYLHHGKKRGKTQHLPNNEETKQHTQQKRGERSLIQRRWRKATPPNRRRKNSNTTQRRWKPSSTTQMERGGTQLHAQRTKRRQHHAKEERKNSNTTQRKKRPNSTTQLSDMGGLFPATQLSFHTRIKKKKKKKKKKRF